MMCEKNNGNNSDPLFGYKSNGKTIFLTIKQAREVYDQLSKYFYAVDLKNMVESVFEDDMALNKLAVTELLPYTEILEDLIRENIDADGNIYADCCQQVISNYIKPKLEGDV